MMQAFVVAVQNSVPVDSMGSATALTQFCRSIGTTLGVTLMGVIVNQGLPPGVRLEGETVEQLSPALRADLADALQPAFLAAAAVCVVLLAVVVVRNPRGPAQARLRRRVTPAPVEPETKSEVRIESVSAQDFMPLEGWDHLELWVGNAKQAAYFYEHAFGFTRTAYAGPETAFATAPPTCSSRATSASWSRAGCASTAR